MSTQTLEHPQGVGPPPVVPPPGAAPPAWQPNASSRRGWRRKLVTGVAIVALGLGSGGPVGTPPAVWRTAPHPPR